jgi:hypothetical protein
MSTSSDSQKPACVTCNMALGANYWHRGACGHHQHEHCALPAIRAGKSYCPRCPQPTRPTAIGAGTVVLGSDSEQIRIVATQLRTEREVNARFTSLFGEMTSALPTPLSPSNNGGACVTSFDNLFLHSVRALSLSNRSV